MTRVARCLLCGETSQAWSDDDVLWTWRRAHLAYRHAGDRPVFGVTEVVDRELAALRDRVDDLEHEP